MDYAFSQRPQLKPVSIDLDALLARVAAQQAASPTAQAYSRLVLRVAPEAEENPRLSLLAGDLAASAPECGTATFANSDGAAPFNPRQPN